MARTTLLLLAILVALTGCSDALGRGKLQRLFTPPSLSAYFDRCRCCVKSPWTLTLNIHAYFTEPFTKVGTLGRLYFFGAPMSWTDARKKCKSMGSRLVELWTDRQYRQVKTKTCLSYFIFAMRGTIQGSRYFLGQRFYLLCFEICTPSLFYPSPLRVQISKQDMHRTFDPINNLIPVHV